MKKRGIFGALLFLLLAALLIITAGCDERILDEAAQILLQEWASQQPQSAAPSTQESTAAQSTPQPSSENGVIQGQAYYLYEDVAAYLHSYGELPPNYFTKAEAKKLGWDADKGNLWEIEPGACIGGDRFGNREGRLPAPPEGGWYECDVEYDGGYRGAQRLIYALDGTVYYTADHYNSFERLY